MANKGERVSSIIAKNVTEIIMFKVKNPNLGFITITGVDVTNDFSYAKVYVSFMGKKGGTPEKRLEELREKNTRYLNNFTPAMCDFRNLLNFRILDYMEQKGILRERLGDIQIFR